jgi:hypothetical protein
MHISALIVALALTSVAGVNTHHFDSKSQAFSVDYPATWSLVGSSTLGPSDSRMDIVSFPDNQRAEAVVIKRGGAEIILLRGQADQTVDDGDKLILRHDIPLNSSSLCPSVAVTRVLKAIVTKDQVPSGVAVYEDDTTYAFACGTESFQLILRHFRGDPKHKDYEDAAIGILNSLRSSSKAEGK